MQIVLAVAAAFVLVIVLILYALGLIGKDKPPRD